MTAEEPAFLNETPVAFETRLVAEGCAYWRSKIFDGRLPARSDIDPAEIPRLLPSVVLLDVVREDTLDMRYRLIGTRVAEHCFSDYTGLRFSEIEHQRAPSKLLDSCRLVAETGRPLLANSDYVGPHQGFRRVHDAILPLAEDGRSVDTLLAFVDFLSKL